MQIICNNLFGNGVFIICMCLWLTFIWFVKMVFVLCVGMRRVIDKLNNLVKNSPS